MHVRRLLPITLIVGTLGLASALPSAAQSTSADANRSTTTTEDRGMDLGWLGLLGLAGLLGLRKRRDSTSDYSSTRPAR
jgi:MYXO-CTERM domain-containing protein